MTPERFVKNAWYVVANAEELSRGPVNRRILDLPVFVYRTQSGHVAALLDRCPHRRFPLSRSQIEGDDVRCGYHGMKFAPDGRCVDVPCQSRIADDLRIRSFEAVEWGDWIWLWMGDEPSAGRSPPQAPEIVDGAGWTRRQVLASRLRARASLLQDNLLDLSHLSYLHASNIGGNGVAQTAPDMKDTPYGLSVRREMLDPVMHQLPLGKAMNLKGPVVRVMAQQFYAPSLHITGSAFFEPDAEGRAGAEIGSFRVLHALTPETATTMHYFQAYQRNFRHGDEACDKTFDIVLNLPVGEDVMAVELIEAELAQARELEPEKHIAADVVGVRGRRLIERLLQAEAESSR